jgi:hypothetical protein
VVVAVAVVVVMLISVDLVVVAAGQEAPLELVVVQALVAVMVDQSMVILLKTVEPVMTLLQIPGAVVEQGEEGANTLALVVPVV